MSSLNEPIARRIATLFRLLGSDFDGEVLGAVAAMKRLFAAEGLAFHDIATVIESCNGEIEERKYSDRDAEIIFAHGVEKGRAEQVRAQAGSPEFYDADGHPRWHAMALFCQQNHQRLRPNEQGFIDDMTGLTLWHEPKPKQARCLLSIFLRLGGRRQ